MVVEAEGRGSLERSKSPGSTRGGAHPSEEEAAGEGDGPDLTADALEALSRPAAWTSWGMPAAGGRPQRLSVVPSLASFSSVISDQIAICDSAVQRREEAVVALDDINGQVRSQKRKLDDLLQQVEKERAELERLKREKRETKTLVKTEDGNILAGFRVLKSKLENEMGQMELDDA